jgi:membrane-bound metal-dependent hydrolase YbcI (DUF457 family)
MFIGHFAVGFAAKRAAPRAGLAPLLAAPLLLDLLWPLFLFAGAESVTIDPGNTAFTPLDLHDYPWSHSLIMALVWSAAFALVYLAVTRYRRGAVVIAAGVFSHWILDWITHRPDMPLWPGSERHLGLGLWRSVPGTVIVEGLLFAGGVALYLRATRARNRVGSIAFWALLVLLVVIYVANVFGPPPPSAEMVRNLAVAAWLFVLWAWWIDRNRAVVVAG